MCKLISKCCVCGTIYGVTKCNIVGQDSNSEKVSHGYCSPACQKFTETQLLVWNNTLGECGTFVLDAGYISNDTLYYKGVRVEVYLTLCNTGVYTNNGNSEEMIFYSPSKKEALTFAKNEARAFNLPIIILN